MTAIPQVTDVIIVGGGLHGCATALHLGLAGLKSVVIEKDHIGRHASSANAGGVRRLGRAMPEVPLAIAALEHWQHIEDLVEDDCGFAATNQIKVAETDDELAALKARSKTLLSNGFKHEEMIDQKQLRELLPAISSHCLGGMIVRGDGHANPFQTVQAFKRKAHSLGAQIFEYNPVSAIEKRGEIWQVSTPDEIFEAPVIVNCAGAWGGQIATMLGDYAPVEAKAFMLMITGRVQPFIQSVVGAQGRSLSFKQFDNGTVLIGGGHQGRAEPETNATHLDFKGLAANAESAATIFPIMRKAQVMRCWAGIEGEMPDSIPVIGKGSASGAFHAFGFSGHGFALAPIVGKIITQRILTGDSDLPINAFSIGRFKTQ